MGRSFQQGHQAPAGPRPAAPVADSSVLPVASEAAPAAAPAKPALCRWVLVRTPTKIGGQNEHAAVITRVHSDELVNVTLHPDGEIPYPVSRIYRADSAEAGSITWRWPPRV